MPLFGGDPEKKAAENAALRAERDRLAALPYVELAAEILERVFSGEGEGAEKGVIERSDLAGHWDRTESIFGIDDDAQEQIEGILLEGVQVLEHACLVRWELKYHSFSETLSTNLILTRLGGHALAEGGVRKALGG